MVSGDSKNIQRNKKSPQQRAFFIQRHWQQTCVRCQRKGD
jgi:hypothetical protein